MEKLINVMLVVVIVLLLKNMYLPKMKIEKNKKRSRRTKSVKEEPGDDSSFSLNNVGFKNLLLQKGNGSTEIIPIGTLEVITKDDTIEVPVSFNKRGQFLIGSAQNCDLVLNSKYIGRHHCSIEYDEDNDEIVLFDNDSKNGVYDSMQNRVEEIVLEKGTDFYLAKCIHLRWEEFNGFECIEEDEPVVNSLKNHKVRTKPNKSSEKTKEIPEEGFEVD